MRFMDSSIFWYCMSQVQVATLNKQIKDYISVFIKKKKHIVTSSLTDLQTVYYNMDNTLKSLLIRYGE